MEPPPPTRELIPDEATGMTTINWHQVSFAPENTNFNHRPPAGIMNSSRSIETIYKRAVEKRRSSSSDECIDMSNEPIDLFPDADFQPDYEDDLGMDMDEESQAVEPVVQLNTSRDVCPPVLPGPSHGRQPAMSIQDVIAKNTIQAEQGKAVMYPNTGMNIN